MGYGELTLSLDIYLTFACSILSLLGSLLVILSYGIARMKTKPRAAQLIFSLALCDFLWFLSSVVQSTFWVTNQSVPDRLCFLCSPVVNFFRMASLVWTVAISHDVWRSFDKRGLRREEWGREKYVYYLVLLVFSAPGAILNIYKQHVGEARGDLGCNPGYEKLGDWYEVFFTELLLIFLGFCANVFCFFQIYHRMKGKAYPQSVRKRRRRIMYHYIIVNIVCWLPTIVFYIVEVAGRHSSLLEIVSRASLYLTGFFNFLVFGMQDPHLKKAFLVVMYVFGCTKWCCCFSEDALGNDGRNSLVVGLKTKEVEKNVMFDGEISINADTSKDKKNIYRYHKLSKEDKRSLYENRPDLDPKIPIERRKKHGGDVSKNSKIIEPLLAASGSEQEHKESDIEESSHSFLEACAAANGNDIIENAGSNATEMKEGRSIDLERAASSPIFSTLLSASVGAENGGSNNTHSQQGQSYTGSSSDSSSVSTSEGESTFNSAVGDGDSSDDDEDDEDRELHAAMRFTQHR